MADKKSTLYTQLSQYFGGNKGNNSGQPKELVKTDNKEEFLIKRIEKQQSKYLNIQGSKLNNLVSQHNLSNQTTRQAAYHDFEQMEYYPILGKALDLYAEESTTKNREGDVLKIFSNEPRVKVILEDLFYNRLNIQVNLPMWTRCTCKYGDDFVFLEMEDKKGITGAKQLPNSEVERTDGGLYDTKGEHKQRMTKFKLRSSSTELYEWQIAHFRLMFDDRRLPYGVSMLEKVRRIWRNLLIAEDAMLTYRVVRAPERRVFKIFVGNMQPNDISSYIDKVMDKIKRRPSTNGFTGEYQSKYNVMSIDDDYVIPVRSDANESSVETLAGAANMSDIADVEYLKDEMFTAIGIPAQFLNYKLESTGGGDGKNLAMLDSRFANTINRIQEAMILTLNKIATIHLFLLGLQEEANNFTLTLNNPSIQKDVQWVEHQKALMTLFRDATTKNDNGISPLSSIMAMEKILGMSETEIIENFEQQRVEKAASIEFESTGEIIKKSGLFDRIDKLIGDPNAALANTSDVGGGGFGSDELGGGGTSGGGESFDSGFGDIGGDLGGSEPAGGEVIDSGGGDSAPPAGGDSTELFASLINKVKGNKKILTEAKDVNDYQKNINSKKSNNIQDILSKKGDQMKKTLNVIYESLEDFKSEYDKITDEIDEEKD